VSTAEDRHKDWIEVLSFSHQVSQPISTALSGSGAVSTAAPVSPRASRSR
jgi:hypothetical protein